jgi:hypothetical protein
MKNIILFLSFFLFSKSFSQETVKSINLNLSKKTDVFQVVEEDKKQVTLFFSDQKRLKATRLNESFEIIDSISTTRPNNDFEDIVGYSINGNKYYSYWSSANNKEIIYQCFDFDFKNTTTKSFPLAFEKEKTIKKITVNNVFYLITCVKNESILNFYIFNDGNLVKKSIDLSNKKFLDKKNSLTTLWDIFNVSTAFESALSVQNISNDSPPSLTFSANKRKIYTNANTLIFSFDINKTFTQLLYLNLSDFTADLKTFTQPYFKTSEFEIADSNSFLSNDKLIQLKLNAERMIISIKNLDGTEFKYYESFSNTEISFKNSDIIQENGSVKNSRILESSKQLLRKIHNLNPSLSCYTLNNKNYLTIGSVSLIQNNNAMLYGGMIGGLAGALIAASLTSNYSLNNLNSYKDRKVVYINCLFDENFNHLNENVNKLAFDNLRDFAEQEKDLISKTIFKLNSSLYYAGYNKDQNKYFFYKFND